MATPSPKKSDLGVRSGSAAAMLAVAGTALWLGGWWWVMLVAVIATGVIAEWAGLVRSLARSLLASVLWTIGGIAYVGVATAMLMFLRSSLLPVSVLVTIIAAVIATDIGAYFAGRTFGGPKIAPAISPSKTWAGLLGGAIAAAATVAVLTRLFHPPGELTSAGIPFREFAIGMAIAVIAQTGDFFESWMKRRAGVKDSGAILPGHGGLFDRLDGLLAVMFVVGVIALANIFVR